MVRSSSRDHTLVMRHAIVIAALLVAPFAASTPVSAQLANERILTIFGEDKCPADTICVRAPENERYRIPKQFRESGVIAPQNQSWAARAQGTMDAGARTGIGSCSASGPGGWTGCWQQQMRAARADRATIDNENNPDIER